MNTIRPESVAVQSDAPPQKKVYTNHIIAAAVVAILGGLGYLVFG